MTNNSAHRFNLRRLIREIRRPRRTRDERQFDTHHFAAAADQERLGQADTFFDWILDHFDPWLKGRILEVGAGTGTGTKKILARHRDVSITALEPAKNLVPELEKIASKHPNVQVFPWTLAEHHYDDLYDAAMYLSVLEHIEDDRAELKLAADRLREGGALLVFVPALEWLYSDLDYHAGHYRRYYMGQLREIAEEAGFEIVDIRYTELAGVIPYLLVYRLLGRASITNFAVSWYDKLLVPISAFLDRIFPHPPFGKNLLMIAVKSESAG